MKFELKNIGKFKNAEVDLDGITVIAGENSTGKSTIEKAVSLTLFSLYNLESFVMVERVTTINQTFNHKGILLDNIFKKLTNAKRRHRVRDVQKLQSQYAVQIALNLPIKTEKLKILIDEYATEHAECYNYDVTKNDSFFQMDNYLSWKNDLIASIEDDISYSDDDIGRSSVTEYVRQFFASQMIRFGTGQEDAYIQTLDNGFENKMCFDRQSKNARDFCSSLKVQMPVTSSTVFIDSPDIFDNLKGNNDEAVQKEVFYLLTPGSRDYGFPKKSVWNAVFYNADDETQGFFSEAHQKSTLIQQEQKERLVDYFHAMIKDVVHGHLEVTNARRLQFIPDHGNRAVEMTNVSTGIKALSILAYAIQQGCISEKSFLLLDEPEINLHPAWQLKYAEILVRMQKDFHINIMITTHSPYFLNAIEVYSAKEQIADRCRYYLTEHEGTDDAIIHEVTDHIDKVYQLLAEPFQKLENITPYD